MSTLSISELEAFICDGLAVVDDLVPFYVIDQASKSFDDLYAGTNPTGIIEQPTGAGIEALYQHPDLERAAKVILQADAVDLVHSAALHTMPADGEWSYSTDTEHVDIQFNEDDWLGAPRRILFTFMIFMDDVTPNRAPTVVRPGSHLQIARQWGSEPAYQDHPVWMNDLPALDYADPVPVVGRKGQVAISSTAIVHAGSRNVSDRPRKMLFVYFAPRGLNLRFNIDREDRRVSFLRGLADRFDPDRGHIVKHAAKALAEIAAGSS